MQGGTYSAEVCIRIASAMARLSRIWWCSSISFACKFKLYDLLSPLSASMAVKDWSCLLIAEKWSRPMKPNAWRDFSAFPTLSTTPTTECKIRSTSLLFHRNPYWQLSRDESLHVTRHNSLSKTILLGILEGGRCFSWQRKCWMDYIKKWTYLPMPELFTRSSCKKHWKRISAESSVISPWQLNWSRDLSEPKTLEFPPIVAEKNCILNSFMNLKTYLFSVGVLWSSCRPLSDSVFLFLF